MVRFRDVGFLFRLGCKEKLFKIDWDLILFFYFYYVVWFLNYRVFLGIFFIVKVDGYKYI